MLPVVNRECFLILGIKNMKKYILFSKFTNTTLNYAYICNTTYIEGDMNLII